MLHRLALATIAVVAAVSLAAAEPPADSATPDSDSPNANAPDASKPTAGKTVTDDSGVYTFTLPKGWSAQCLKPKTPGCSFKFTLSEQKITLFFHLFLMPGMRSAKAQRFMDRPALLEREKGRNDKVGLDPLPHLTYETGEKSVQHDVIAYRMINRNGISMRTTIPAAHWESARKGFFQIAISMKAAIPEWPARPEGFADSVRDGYLYLVHPDVKGKDVKKLHKLVLAEEKLYVERHGVIEKSADSRPIIVVHSGGPEIRALSKDASDDPNGMGCSNLEGRAFIKAFSIKKDDSARTGAVFALWRLFHNARYASTEPAWIREGEARLAAIRSWCGKPLPWAVDEEITTVSEGLVTFDKLAAMRDADWGRYKRMSAAYVAGFIVGPKKYRAAYQTFLDTLAATGDWESAERTLLETYDPIALQIDLEVALAKKLKKVKR